VSCVLLGAKVLVALPKKFSGFGDDLFGCLSVLCDGLGACVSVLACSGLTSGGHVAIVVEETLPHVGGELVDASLFDVPEPVLNFL